MVMAAHAVADAGPGFVAGRVFEGRSERALSAAAIGRVADWLRAHRSGWQANLATPPLPLLRVCLDTAAQRGAVCLLLWPGAARPGWNHAVIMERPAGHPVGVRTVGDAELAALLGAVA
jgi:hypothetical protein